MKNISILFFTIIALSGKAQELSINQVLEKYYIASGFDKLQKVNTIIMTGHITKQDYMPMKIIKMRPDKYKMEFDIQDVTAYQSYDGKIAWMTAPWTGNAKPQIMNEAAAKDIKNKSDFDGALYNLKDKKHIAELIGKESINDIEVYKIKLSLIEGGTEFYFIDSKDFLLQKKIVIRISRDKETEVTSFYSDYRDVDGIKFYFISENFMAGQPYSTIQFDTIELNKTVDEKIFKITE